MTCKDITAREAEDAALIDHCRTIVRPALRCWSHNMGTLSDGCNA